MPDSPDTESRDPRPAVVVALQSSFSSVREIRAPHLPEELHEPIRAAGAAWRDPKAVARRLDELRQQHDLPGLAIWYALEKNAPTVPQPLDLPFEPLELDEGRAPLAELVAEAQADEQTRRSNAFRRGLVRIGLPVFVLLPQLFNGVTQILIHRSRSVVLLWVGIIGVLVLAFGLVWWLADDWFIVPGGIVVRRRLIGRVGERLRLYTPADALLIIRQNQPGYILEIWQDGRPRQRKVTELEAAAALGAWQSKLPPPDLSQLSDLMHAGER